MTPEHRQTLEKEVLPNLRKLYYPHEADAVERYETAIRALLEENERLEEEKAALIASKYVGPDRPDLFAKIEAALALHVKDVVGAEGLECTCGEPWPCPTVKALRGEP